MCPEYCSFWQSLGGTLLIRQIELLKILVYHVYRLFNVWAASMTLDPRSPNGKLTSFATEGNDIAS